MATLTECVEVPKQTVVSEATRERETFRYDDSLFTNVRHNNSGSPIPQSELVTCSDVIFTALARLAASQTGAAKSMISLFDQTHQYIIAEASATTPLVPNLGYDSHHETLWHCGTAIPRSHSACENTLCSDDPPESGPDGFKASHQLPVIVVDDVTTHPEYSAKPYCRPGGAARFYAAVPIRTDRGVNIGVICVIDTKPALPWDYQMSRMMRELSKAVTEHLETISLKSNQRRSEKKATGLTAFVEGDVQPGLSAKARRENEKRLNGVSKPQRPRIEDIQSTLGGMDIESSTPVTNPQESTNGQEKKSTQTVLPASDGVSVYHNPSQGLETPREAFSKAARIVKDSIEIDGCMFVNADMLEFSTTGASNEWMEEDAPTRRRSTFSHHDSEDTYTTGSSEDRSRPSCQVLGSSEEDTLKCQRACVSLPQALLARMIRRYPKGHIFNLDANGDLQPDELSDESNHRALTNGQDKNQSYGDVDNKQENQLRIQRREANILRETFPGSRSVAFVPIWDLRKKRWSAGGFIYSFNIKRSFTIDLDLSYLRALGMLAAAEAFRLETLAADRAKTDTLGSLSHELRSPLHGAVLSVELLNDTDLSIPQQNIVRTIETCCRTLSDTIDHLLEYSKVNKPLPQEGARESQSDRYGLSKAPTIGGPPNPSRKVVQLDVLAEEVLESVYAGFNFQHVSLAQAAQSTSQPPRRPGYTSIRRMDTMQAMEELRTPVKDRGSIETKIGDVEIFLVIDSRPSWGFYTQPGPVRRIIMNLFGNSLKYTTAGLIRVSLEQTGALGTDDTDCWVTITVSDTGIGISDDFLRNGLFKPFSQENHLSPGTGLGLSFVKQIAAQFGGQISVKSRVGTGTTVTVRLPMKLADNCHRGVCEVRQREEEFEAQTDKLRGLRVKVIDFGNNESDSSGTKMESPCQLVRNMCNEWLGMQVNTGFETPCLMPDLAIWSEQGFESPFDQQDTMPDVPNIVVCANALTVHQYACGTKAIPRPGIFEFISQPLGPRKLAKACSLALYRWTVAQTSTDSPTTAPPDQDSLTVPENIASSIPHPTSPFPLSAEPTPTQTTQGYFRNPEFLLVDDNFINLKILSSYMKKLKQPYQTASDGLQAVTAYEADPGRYTCVLMDISMPVMDGFEATRRIRAFETQQGLRPALILALTGLASEEAQREAEVSGLDLFLTKPVRLKELGPILRAKGVLEEESNVG